MNESPDDLRGFLDALSRRARALGLTDTDWAERAGVRKETLSRLRRRHSCDLATLRGLAHAVGARLGVLEAGGFTATPDGHFPASVDRAAEERLLELGTSRNPDPGQWAASGPRFFMAGLAVMLASARDQDRPRLLALAEQLHPGASEPAVFARWLERSPLRPTRFLSLLDAALAHAA